MKNFFLLLLFSSFLFSNEYAIVANKSFKNLSHADIKAIYLKKLSYINNKKIVPINLSSRNSIRKSFEKHILNMNFRRLKAYWMKQHYFGNRPPITMKSQRSVLRFIKKVDLSIGYIDIKEIDKNLKILYKWSD